jgi:hypothetical protein
VSDVVVEKAFYTMCDSRFFLGVVGLLNSLRLAGHDEPLFVLDCGLEPGQRLLLEPHAHIVSSDSPLSPILQTGAMLLSHPASAMVLLDADVIVTRSLRPLQNVAAAGKIAAVADGVPHRFHPEWEQLLDLGPLRRQTYVNNGLVALPYGLGSEIIERATVLQTDMNLDDSILGGGDAHGPFYYADQDILNALLSSEARADQVEIFEHRLAPFPPFDGLRLVDARTLTCRYPDGVQPFTLHHVGPKPWLSATRVTIYSTLLPRLWFGPDVLLRLNEQQVPLRFRAGSSARAALQAADFRALLRAQRGRLGIRRRLSA